MLDVPRAATRRRLGASQRDRTEIIRSRVASGALPSVEPTKAWGGTSTGSICDGCSARILAGQIEYEVQFASTLVFRLHGACFMIWQQERGNVRREISGGSAASPWTLDDVLMATAESRRVAAEMRDTSRRIRATSAALCAVAHAHDDCSAT